LFSSDLTWPGAINLDATLEPDYGKNPKSFFWANPFYFQPSKYLAVSIG
jgi:hypothetical protein